MPAPEKQIKTHVFDGNADNSQPAALPPPPKQVQTGAFGDPNGVPAKDAPNAAQVTVARVGAYDLPPVAGRGNATAGSPGSGDTIRSAGFPDTISPAHSDAQEARNVQTGGFRNVVIKATSSSASSAPQVQEQPVLQPVEIISKPRPAYTPVARQQKVEGEVLLDVVFTASGSLQVNRVVKGLGYGLDDMAVAAAHHIQFHPAKRDGKPCDFAAVVRIVFQLSD
jgi:TonB family protein